MDITRKQALANLRQDVDAAHEVGEVSGLWTWLDNAPASVTHARSWGPIALLVLSLVVIAIAVTDGYPP
jgi:hypothetical protein